VARSLFACNGTLTSLTVVQGEMMILIIGLFSLNKKMHSSSACSRKKTDYNNIQQHTQLKVAG
jgi:hypothetical protein